MEPFTFENPLIVAEGGGFSRIHFSKEFLGPQSQFLSQLAGNIPVYLNNVAKIPGYPYPVHLIMQAGEVRVLMRVPELKLTTYYRPIGENRCAPVWENGTGTDFPASFIWKPNIPLWFLVVFNPCAGTAGATGIETVASGMLKAGYLLAIKPDGPGAYRLPICNLYPDARICWSINRDTGPYRGPTPTEGTLLERFAKLLDYIQTSRWNGHLSDYHRQDQTQAVVNFTMDGKTITPPPNWETFCSKVSNAYYNELPLQQLTSVNL